MTEKFKKREVVEMLGIPSRRLQFITDQGLLSDTEAFPGRGRDRFYSRVNLFEILLVEELSKYGMPTSFVKNVVCNRALTLGFRNAVNSEAMPDMFLVVHDDGSAQSFYQWQDEIVRIDMRKNISAFVVNIRVLVGKAKTV